MVQSAATAEGAWSSMQRAGTGLHREATEMLDGSVTALGYWLIPDGMREKCVVTKQD